MLGDDVETRSVIRADLGKRVQHLCGGPGYMFEVSLVDIHNVCCLEDQLYGDAPESWLAVPWDGNGVLEHVHEVLRNLLEKHAHLDTAVPKIGLSHQDDLLLVLDGPAQLAGTPFGRKYAICDEEDEGLAVFDTILQCACEVTFNIHI